MSPAIRFLLIAASLLWGACEQQADVASPKTYRENGIEFAHPGNWKVTEDVREGEMRYLFVESPGNAILIIQLFPASQADTISAFAKNFSEGSKNAVSWATASAPSFSAVTGEGKDEVLTENMSMSAAGQSVPHLRVYRRRVEGERVVFLIAQVATEDAGKATKGFDQIVESLKVAP